MRHKDLMTLPDGREVWADEYMMAHAPLNVVMAVCEPFTSDIQPPPPCPQCEAATEHWFSYCAMCGHHIASGSLA